VNSIMDGSRQIVKDPRVSDSHGRSRVARCRGSTLTVANKKESKRARAGPGMAMRIPLVASDHIQSSSWPTPPENFDETSDDSSAMGMLTTKATDVGSKLGQ